jgi:hypothetical protein
VFLFTSAGALPTGAKRKAGGRIVSIPSITLVERLELLVFMTSMAMSCGLLVLISAQAGKSGLGVGVGVRGDLSLHRLALLEVGVSGQGRD